MLRSSNSGAALEEKLQTSVHHTNFLIFMRRSMKLGLATILLGCLLPVFAFAQGAPAGATGVTDEFSEANEIKTGIVPWSKTVGCPDKPAAEWKKAPIGIKIKCGRVELTDLPKQIVYWITLVLKLLPSVGVIMMLVGGFFYLYGAASDDKEKGKNAIMYVIIGLVVALASWWIVDLLQQWLTS